MDRKEVVLTTKQMCLEQKILLLSETEEAYIKGFIEGAILGHQQKTGRAKPKPRLKGKSGYETQ
jgi:hypothetical protein